MEIRKYSFKKNKRNDYKVNTRINSNKFINKNKVNKEEKIQKENFFDKINKILFQKYFKIFLPILSSCIIICILIYGSIELYRHITGNDNFLLTEIDIKGETYLTKDEIIDLSSLQKNTNILKYKINQIEANLLKSNWIQDVKIKRTLPSKFIIEIIERKPSFIIINNNELYYLDSKAQYIEKVNKNKFISLPVLYTDNATINEINILPDFINELETTDFQYAINEISWINISPLYGFELFIEPSNLTLQIDKQNYEENIKNLASVINDLKKRKEIRKVRKIQAAFNKVMIIKEQ